MELRTAVEGEWETLLEQLGASILEVNNQLSSSGEEYSLGLRHDFHWIDGETTGIGWLGCTKMPRAHFYVDKLTERDGIWARLSPTKKERMLSCNVNVGIQFSPRYDAIGDMGNHYMTIHSEEIREQAVAFVDTVLGVVPQVYLIAETEWDGKKYKNYRKHQDGRIERMKTGLKKLLERVYE